MPEINVPPTAIEAEASFLHHCKVLMDLYKSCNYDSLFKAIVSLKDLDNRWENFELLIACMDMDLLVEET